MPKSKRFWAITAIVVAGAAVVALAATLPPEEKKAIKILSWPSPGALIKYYMLEAVIEDNLGYDVEMVEVGAKAMAWLALSQGDADLLPEVWTKEQKNFLDAYAGSYVNLGTNMPGGWAGASVPGYVYDAGVHSFTDLDRPEFRANFDRTGDGVPDIIGFEPGSPQTEAMRDAITNDTYGLGDWNLVETGLFAAFAEATSAMDDGEWVVFLSWKPHWIHSIQATACLEDPEEVQSGWSTGVATIARLGFDEDYPELTEFLRKWQIQMSDVEEIMLKSAPEESGGEGKSIDEAVRWWLANNQDVVTQWLSD